MHSHSTPHFSHHAQRSGDGLTESGAILSFALVFSIALIAMAGAFVVNSLVVRQAKTDLDYHAYRICFQAAQQLPSYENARNVFQEQLGSIPLDIVRAVLVLPAGTATAFGESPGLSSTVPWQPPPQSLPVASHLFCVNPPQNQDRSPILPGTLGDCGQDCVVFDTCHDETEFSIADNFPPSLFDNQRNSGNTIACHLEASSGFFRFPGISTPSLNAKASVAWGKKLRGSQSYVPGEALTLPRVVLAVGPQMNIPTISAPYSQADDSVTRVLNNSADLQEWFGFRLDSGAFEALELNEAFQGNDPAIVVQGLESIIGADEITFSNVATPLAARADLINNCANLPSVSRNLLSSSLAALLARDGLLRRSTEVLLVNSAFLVSDENALSSNNQFLPPTQIVPYGQDLAELNYQIPYATFHNGAGFINPFFAAGGTQNNLAALQTGQLKICQHLYDVDEVTLPLDFSTTSISIAPALTNFGLDSGWQDYNFLNFWSSTLPQLEPSELFSLSPNYLGVASPPTFTEPPSYGGGAGTVHLGDACPWNAQEGSCTGAGAVQDHRYYRRLNAIEVLSSLGSIQTCPFDQPTCSKQFNLSDPNYSAPNVEGLIRYLFDNALPTRSAAIAPPGIFPSNLGGIVGDLNNGPYQSEFRAPSPHREADSGTLLFITHGGFESGLVGGVSCDDPEDQSNWPEQVQQVADLLANRPNWRVIVIFMPTNAEQEQALTCMQRAFNVSDISEMNNSRSMIFHLSPIADDYDGCDHPTAGYDTGNTERNYRNFWQDLLTPGATPPGCAQNAAEIAVEIYRTAMMTTELLY
jgi:hypothetical protein